MCISTSEAAFSGTIVYCGRQHHPVHGLIHVLGYQNTAVNLADGPNAMLLHLPTTRLTPRHFLSAGRTGDVLSRMVAAVEPVAAGAHDIAWMSAEPQPVQVFDHDVYTVLLATDPTAVPTALRQVPPHRRPDLDPDLLRFYADHFPDHTIAVCCFDNADARRAKPLLLWYPPLDPDQLTVPALDSHTGTAPDLDASVTVDHWVLLSTDRAPAGWGEPVDYPKNMRHSLRAFLPTAVVGRYYGEGQTLTNGDFTISHRNLLAGDLDRIERLRPTRR
ncbi:MULTISPECIES: hypothetical protein [Streptomyces]|uniref:Uncharacterized protein n=1 Tax=Streptomyces flaveolus TaxID=67297 RepID=A0ABV3AP22_9ACTN|nr:MULTISPECIES: hypothetical protein [Streptomyces]KMS77605.1 hypothetical protein ACZ91_64135 [Streptomyces regensis]KOG58958.1 hypothetical protein ADK77_42110 [Streptomyces antibioticus]MBG7697256.1 hypothetical protein [Streptomyces sp. MC1]